MRVETVHGRHLLCGVILPLEQLEVGQRWAPAAGGNYEVEIVGIRGTWIAYEGDGQPLHEKDAFAFQCRYCLVLDGPTIPPSLRPSR